MKHNYGRLLAMGIKNRIVLNAVRMMAERVRHVKTTVGVVRNALDAYADRVANGQWEESKHPRAEDGRFGSVPGSDKAPEHKDEKAGDNGAGKEHTTVETARSTPAAFKKGLDAAKATVPPDMRWRVDSTKTEEKLGELDTWMTPGGSVFAVSKTGDIEAVCVNKSDTATSGKALIAAAVKAGGVKLDSFEGNHAFYRKCGFEPVSWTRWDDQYAPQGWEGSGAGREDILFYRYTGNKVRLTYDQAQAELIAFKKANAAMSYEEAGKFRDSKIKKGK